MFKAAGASNFDCESWLNDHRTSNWLLRIPVVFAQTWPEYFRDQKTEIHYRWPELELRGANRYSFPVGVTRGNTCNFRVFPGLTIDVKTTKLVGFVHILMEASPFYRRRPGLSNDGWLLDRFLTAALPDPLNDHGRQPAGKEGGPDQ